MLTTSKSGYDKELQTPYLLSRSDLASQVSRYIETFNLNIINSAKIQSTHYDPSTERWHISFQTPAGPRSAVSKHLVLATGIGSQKPNMPQIADRDLYQGISVHSAQYQNAKVLAENGAKVGDHMVELNVSGNAHQDLVCPRDWIRQHCVRCARGLPQCRSQVDHECPLSYVHRPCRLCLPQDESWCIRLWR